MVETFVAKLLFPAFELVGATMVTTDVAAVGPDVPIIDDPTTTCPLGTTGTGSVILFNRA